MPKQKTTATYSSLSSELEALLAKLQAPDIAIDEALTLYERGLALARQIEVQLVAAENRIEQLRQRYDGEG